MTLAGLVVAVGSFGVAALEYAKSGTSSTPGSPLVSNSQQPIVLKVEQEAPRPPSRLSQLVNERTIGRQLQYFEAISGPAQEVSGRHRSYEIDGCTLAIDVGDDQQISALSFDVTGSCTFEWRDMAHNMGGLGRPEQTTIRQFLDYVGDQSISHLGGCTSLCGNMADPEIWIQRFGSHADDFIDVTVGVTMESPREVTALGRLSDVVEANLGRDATYDLSQACDRRIIGWIRSTLGSLRIERVELRVQDVGNPQSVCDLSSV